MKFKNKYDLLDLLYEIPYRFTGDKLSFQLYLSKCIGNFKQAKNGILQPYKEIYLGLKELKIEYALNSESITEETVEARIKPYTILLRSLPEVKKVKK